MLFAGQPGCIFFKLPGMKQKFTRFRPPTPDEQEVLTHLVVRLVPTDRVKECDRLITEHHYLKSAQLVGEHLRYVAEYRGQWMALSTWSAAALHIRARDSFIGWIEEQRRTRLPLVVNNSRLLVLPLCRCPNLISRFMKFMLGRLSQDDRLYAVTPEGKLLWSVLFDGDVDATPAIGPTGAIFIGSDDKSLHVLR